MCQGHSLGAYNRTYSLAPRPPEKDSPRRPLATLGAEHWLPMFEQVANVPMFEHNLLMFECSVQTLADAYANANANV